MRFIFIIFWLLVTLTHSVPETLAATAKVESDFRNFHVGDIFTVDLIVDTEGKIINAAEVIVIFPAEFLAYEDYDDGASVFSLWIEKPQLNPPNQIHLAGITPGGFVGESESLITLNFKVIHTGQGKIEIRTADFLLHDGLGTKTNVATQNLHLTSTAGDSTIVVKNVDDEIPESFNPEIMYDRNLFDGQAVLIFSTKDKGSGLDHFEVKEGKFGRYESVVSPYLIKNQTLDRNIFIRAIDKNGNVRTEIIYPQIGQFSYKHVYVIMSILVLLCVPFVILFYRRFRF